MIKKIMVLLICVLVLPIVVNADMGAPEITSYNVLVTNANGAQTYDYDGNKLNKIFSFNENLTVIMEISIDGEIYLGVQYKENDQDYNYYYINEKDVSINGEVDFDKFSKSKGKLYVFDEGAELYNGPSKKYGVIENSNIPVGTTLTYEYSDELWAYVLYNGKKGWIYKYSYEGFSQYEDLETSVCDVEKSEYITLKDEIVIYEKPDLNSNNKKVSIPRNTIVDSDKSFYRYPKSSFRYIKYGEYEGWIYVSEESDTFGSSDYNYKSEITKVLTVDSVDLTEFIEGGETILVIPKGEKITLETCFVYEKDIYDDDYSDEYYYIEYKGNKGWVRADKLAIYEDSTLLTLKEINLLKDFNSQDIQSTLQPYYEIDGFYRYDDYISDAFYYYIEKDSASGWVNDISGEYGFAYSTSCNQYFVLEKNGQAIMSLNGEQVKVVPYQTVLTELYYYNKDGIKYSIVEYEGEKYILRTDSYVAPRSYASRYVVKDDNSENLIVYKDEMLGEVSFEISNGEKFDVLFVYGEWGAQKYFINYNGNKGWISADSDKIDVISYEKVCLVNENLEIEYGEENSASTPKLEKYVNSKTVIISCVIAAVAISLTAGVIIVLVNKSKKNKNKKDGVVNNIQK